MAFRQMVRFGITRVSQSPFSVRKPFLILLVAGLPATSGLAQVDSSAKRPFKALFLPIAARSIETDWSFGGAGSLTFKLKAADTSTRTSNSQVLALYSIRRQFIVAVNGTTYFPGEKYILSHQFSYSHFPDKFWGLGSNAPDANVEDYTFRQFYVFLHLQRQLRPRFFLGLWYEYQRLLEIDYQAGGLFDQQQVTGRLPYSVSGAGPSFTYDSRNNAFAPDRGALLQFYISHFDPALGSTFRFTTFVVDTRKFIRTSPKQVLALQAYGFFNTGEVPLRSLASFGGSSSMRGYYDGRYRSRNQVVVQAEYRVLLLWRLGAVAFADLGNVSDDLSDLTFKGLKYSYGGGLRFSLSPKERLNLRLDYGIGSGSSHGFYVQLGEAF